MLEILVRAIGVTKGEGYVENDQVSFLPILVVVLDGETHHVD
jgi:hypothetical protein